MILKLRLTIPGNFKEAKNCDIANLLTGEGGLPHVGGGEVGKWETRILRRLAKSLSDCAQKM